MDDKVSLIKKGIEVEPPPSQEGREYILAQVKHYIEVAEEQVQTGLKELSKDAEEYLLAHDWQGREQTLENTVKKACILSDGQMLKLEDFDIKDRPIKSIGIGKFVEVKLQGYMRNIKNFEKFNLYETVIPEVEKALILMVMKETKWNQTKAANLLGINRNTLRDKIKKLKISKKS